MTAAAPPKSPPQPRSRRRRRRSPQPTPPPPPHVTKYKAPSPSPSPSSRSETSPDSLPASAAAAAFPSWYLRTVTQELAEDLDKVRGAPDFGDAALPLLVHALQQGEGCFAPAEKARVMRGGMR
ncbi:hypothetical protein B0J12DRAFT_643043 [Macrophomina phaseolina]|uniref:Ribosome assembly protein 3 n=1 Tax=Macrophomina phaseolina TaxID=35725 RepID=A0ABQ8GSN6_9PEZI|nr:hypothetical protein B0J12DRAFT_643043 [Macrophomina phaseolina]